MGNNSGFASQSAARGLGQGAYLPLEQVLADPPGLVIAAGDERMQRHPALRGLRGVRYASLEPNLLYCGGPTIPRLVGRLAELRDSVGTMKQATIPGGSRGPGRDRVASAALGSGSSPELTKAGESSSPKPAREVHV